MRAAIALAACLLGACFVDVVGEPDAETAAAGTGAGASTTTAGSGGATTSTSTTGSSSSSSGGGDGGGGGEPSTCGDGVVQAAEQCEDGNNAAADGCTGCAFDAATCGDGVFQAGETCESGDPECVGCAITGGTCFNAAALPLGTTTQTLTSQSKPPFPNDCNVQGSTTQVFRFDAGAYPRGVLLALVESTGTQWPAVWASYGCGSEVLTPCYSSPGPFSAIRSPVLAPGLSVYFGIADESDTGGNMTLVARPFRAFWLDAELTSWSLGGGSWVYDNGLQEIHDVNGSTENKSRAIAPAVFVGGLDAVTVALHYGKTAGGAFRLIASTDGGTTFGPLGMDLPEASFSFGANAERQLTLNGATSVIIGVELDNPMPGGTQIWFNQVAVLEL